MDFTVNYIFQMKYYGSCYTRPPPVGPTMHLFQKLGLFSKSWRMIQGTVSQSCYFHGLTMATTSWLQISCWIQKDIIYYFIFVNSFFTFLLFFNLPEFQEPSVEVILVLSKICQFYIFYIYFIYIYSSNHSYGMFQKIYVTSN